MAVYKIVGSRKGKRFESEPLRVLSYVQFEAKKLLAAGSLDVITIVRDSEGEDHPDNKGKFFLHQLIK